MTFNDENKLNIENSTQTINISGRSARKYCVRLARELYNSYPYFD